MKPEVEQLLIRYDEIQAEIFQASKSRKLSMLREVSKIAQQIADLGESLPGLIKEKSCPSAKHAERRSNGSKCPPGGTCRSMSKCASSGSANRKTERAASCGDTAPIGQPAPTPTSSAKKRKVKNQMAEKHIEKIIAKDFKGL